MEIDIGTVMGNTIEKMDQLLNTEMVIKSGGFMGSGLTAIVKKNSRECLS